MPAQHARPAWGGPGGSRRTDPIIRSYRGERVASRPICETKHRWANSVLRWGTTGESLVVNVFVAYARIFPPGAGAPIPSEWHFGRVVKALAC